MLGCVARVSLLERINGHDDLAALTDEQRIALCDEIRSFLVERVAKTGGHLASNLGVVELTVAVETVFDTNNDRLVFDVGHQSYVHKMLTGRQADFDRLRQFGGIAGFPKPSESRSDSFVAGHASSAVSIALGMARARTLLKDDYHVVALMGDGAATGGMVYEGLNDAAESGEPMVVILNDNEMSIDKNVGGMAKHLSRLRTKESYLDMKDRYRSVLTKVPGGRGLYHFSQRVKERVKQSLLRTTIFENMGMTYLGPVDGHDLKELIRIFRVAKDMRKPVLVHVLTQKGRGYAPAEQQPSIYHGVGRFDPISGQIPCKNADTFSDAFGQTMMALAKEDPRVCAITAAMPGGTGLLSFKEAFPDRLFDVGIAEEHAVSMAGGLAKQGMVPVVALYSTFLQRAFDQIIQDVALLGLHVVFAVDRAGLVGEDGETHHGVFDVGFLRQIPGMTVLCPSSCQELSDMLLWAVRECRGPVAIRYPRGGNRCYAASDWTDMALNSAVKCHKQGDHVTIITYGTMLDNALTAAESLAKDGISASVLRLMSIAPLPVNQLIPYIRTKHVLILEETAAQSSVCHELSGKILAEKPNCRVQSLTLGNQFVPHGALKDLYSHYELDGEGIAEFVRKEHFYEN
ncbi:MAG: 1-deoxy-D-xylulose-5-phosphate synthase [Ruminococcaceae bacterium]|nr:1-deoxy-D-xylulose-5-phosphate synthase [Oscillospiraceae bacterium]